MITPQEAEKARRDLAVARYGADLERHEKAIDAHLVEAAGNVAADGSTEWTWGVQGIAPIIIEELVARYACWNAVFDQSGAQIVFHGKQKQKRKRKRDPGSAGQGESIAEDVESRAGIDPDGEYTIDGDRL